MQINSYEEVEEVEKVVNDPNSVKDSRYVSMPENLQNHEEFLWISQLKNPKVHGNRKLSLLKSQFLVMVIDLKSEIRILNSQRNGIEAINNYLNIIWNGMLIYGLIGRSSRVGIARGTDAAEPQGNETERTNWFTSCEIFSKHSLRHWWCNQTS